MSSDWAMVWITVVYVFATCAICLANIKSANATREQLSESKRQFDEENRAFITVTFEIVRSGLAVLHLQNHGKRIAAHVKVKINESFINNIPSQDDKDHVRLLTESDMTVGIGQSWYVCLGSHLQLDDLAKEPLDIDVSYSDDKGFYKEQFHIELDQYFWSLIYDSPIEDIYESEKSVATSLGKMAKSIASIERDIKANSKESSNV